MYFIKIKIFISTYKKIDYYIGLKDASKYLLAEINITVNESQYPTDWEPWPYMPLSSSGPYPVSPDNVSGSGFIQ